MRPRDLCKKSIKMNSILTDEDHAIDDGRYAIAKLRDVEIDLDRVQADISHVAEMLNELVPEIKASDLPTIVIALQSLYDWSEDPSKYLTEEGLRSISNNKEKLAVETGEDFLSKSSVRQLLDELYVAINDYVEGKEEAESEEEDEEVIESELDEEETTTLEAL
jgi:hypothetical protein